MRIAGYWRTWMSSTRTCRNPAIAAEQAEEHQKFFTAYCNPYRSNHRPCGFAPIETNRRGKRKCVYRHKGYRTPDEKLTSLQGGQKYLQEGITELRLKRRAGRITDIEAVQRMQKAQRALLARCWPGR
jgi:hypothetical protein